jgi:hypothetical protein
MATLANGGTITLTGATFINVVGAPTGSNKREVLSCWVENLDTALHTFSHRFHKTAGSIDIPLPGGLVLAAGEKGWLTITYPFVLGTTDESYQVAIDGAHTTTAPRAMGSYFEVP